MERGEGRTEVETALSQAADKSVPFLCGSRCCVLTMSAVK